jgi:NADH dehydrogenase
MKKRRRVVILGAGFGGLLTALRLSRMDATLDIVLVDRSDMHVYKPWLYDVATSMLVDPERQELRDLARSASFQVEHILEANRARNVRFKQAEVKTVDRIAKHVVFSDDHTMSYDNLVIALGSEVNYFNIPGMKEFAMPLSTVKDAMYIRAYIEETFQKIHQSYKKRCTIIIVGAGPTGTEAAAELGNFLMRCDREGLDLCGRCRLVLIDAGDNVLGPFSAFTQGVARKRLESFNIEIQTQTMVTHVAQNEIHAKATKSEEHSIIPYDVLIWAGGVRPNDVLAKLDLQKTDRGRLKVDEHLLVDGSDDIFALGDCAAFIDSKGRELPPTAWAAVEASAIVAKNIYASGNGDDLKIYKPYKHWPAIITLGGHKAAAEVQGLKFFGGLAFILRRLVDLRYFLQILPFMSAILAWRRGVFLLGKND